MTLELTLINRCNESFLVLVSGPNSWSELFRPTARRPIEIVRLLSRLIKTAVLVLYGAPPRYTKRLFSPFNHFRNRHSRVDLDYLSQFVHALFFIYFLNCFPRNH